MNKGAARGAEALP